MNDQPFRSKCYFDSNWLYACLRTNQMRCRAVKLARMAMIQTAMTGWLNTNIGARTIYRSTRVRMPTLAVYPNDSARAFTYDTSTEPAAARKTPMQLIRSLFNRKWISNPPRMINSEYRSVTESTKAPNFLGVASQTSQSTVQSIQRTAEQHNKSANRKMADGQ